MNQFVGKQCPDCHRSLSPQDVCHCKEISEQQSNPMTDKQPIATPVRPVHEFKLGGFIDQWMIYDANNNKLFGEIKSEQLAHRIARAMNNEQKMGEIKEVLEYYANPDLYESTELCADKGIKAATMVAKLLASIQEGGE